MSRKESRKLFNEEDEEADDEEEDVKCPPQHDDNDTGEEGKRKKDENYFEDTADVKCSPMSNPNKELPSHMSATSNEHLHHHLQKNEYQDEAAITMEEGVPFEEEKEKISVATPHNSVAQAGIDVEEPDTSGGQNVVSSSRDLDVSPGTETLDSQEPHHIEGRRTPQFPQQVRPGAYRYRGSLPDDQEGDDEDDFTIQSNAEPPPIPPAISPTFQGELVNIAEEDLLIQEQVNQTLQAELEQAVVAEVIPELTSKRVRQWKFAGAFLLVLIVLGVVLGITLRPRPSKEQEIFIPQDLIDFLSNSSSGSEKALRNSSTPQYKALKWLAGDENLMHYADQQKIQRFVLATLYYSTKGDNWTHNDFWLSNADVCGKWYQFDNRTINCTSAGEVSSLLLASNNLVGTIPAEIGMLSNSLGEFNIHGKMSVFKLPLSPIEMYYTSLMLSGCLIHLSTEYLSLQSNNLRGAIPTEIASLTKLSEYTHDCCCLVSWACLLLMFNSLSPQWVLTSAHPSHYRAAGHFP